jgi:hypothetical protein
VGSRQAPWTKYRLFWMHVLKMVGLAWYTLSAKAYY